VAAAQKLGGSVWVVKAQIHAGGAAKAVESSWRSRWQR
jgi:succinyl-CoA synthetase beta subunit